MVGGSGVFLDMGILYLLADPRTLGLSVTFSKIYAAEVAMINNFVWNEFWTFHRPTLSSRPSTLNRRIGLLRRFILFNTICGLGIGLAVLLLHTFHTWLGWNLYLSNLLAITLVTFWNFGLNSKFNWNHRTSPPPLRKNPFVGEVPAETEPEKAGSGRLRQDSEPRIKVIWLVMIIAVQLGTAAWSQAADFVQISARINVIENRNEAEEMRSYSVLCTVGTNEWRIENDFMQGAECKWHFDGTNVYSSIRPISPPSKEISEKIQKGMRLAIVPFDIAKSNLTIRIYPSSDGVPLGDQGANIPWLAFCSGSYLRRPARLIPMPVAESRYEAYAFAYSDKTDVFEDALGAPRTIELFADKSLIAASVKRDSFRGKHDVDLWARKRPNFESGSLRFQYAVIESTNVQGWNVPLKFEYSELVPTTSGIVVTQSHGFGIVTNICPSGQPNLLFVPSLAQTVVDYRFSNAAKGIDGLVYRFTNSAALPKADPMLQRKLSAQLAKAVSASSQKTFTPAFRWTILCLIFLPALVFAGKAVLRTLHSIRDKTQTKNP
jgi:putative flippase GtrA